MQINKKILFNKIPKYYAVSLFSVIINLGIYWFLVYIHLNYILAAIIGFGVETIIAYLLNRFWTFSNTRVSFEVGYLRSFIVAISVLIFILIFTYVGVEILKINYMVSRIITGIIIGLASFVFDAKFSFAVWPNK